MEENNLKGAGKTPGTADQAETPQTPHKRRVRYKGTHPRSYKEKYKELQPEKYGDTIAKVISNVRYHCCHESGLYPAVYGRNL